MALSSKVAGVGTNSNSHVRTVTISEAEHNRLTNSDKEYQALLSVLPTKILSPLRNAARQHAYLSDMADSIQAEADKVSAAQEQMAENLTKIVSSAVDNMSLPFTNENEE